MEKMNSSEKINKILELKKEKGALVLAHYYQNLEIQHVADYCGDSFELAKIARASDKDIIVFCGVYFMAESAKIMNPEKRIFIPRKDAGCQMADMVTPEIVLEMKEKYPDAAVVCYINSTAATKAVCDICVTSSNAVKVVGSLPHKEIIFVPDMNLGAYVEKQFPDKTFRFMKGCCPIHEEIALSELLEMKEKYPDAKIAIHPECRDELLAQSDYIGSTSGILDYCRSSEHKEFIIATECAIVERLKEECPDKTFHLMSTRLVCPNMKKTRLDDLLYTLENLDDEVYMSEKEMESARKPLERMLEATKG